MTLTPGSHLGPYEISQSIGAGGMGQVYRARDSRLGREVAIKVLPAEVSSGAGQLARLEREARLASSLNHPNVVTIHEFARSDGVAYIAMELVAGDSLRHVLRSGPLSRKDLISFASNIADGLAAAHALGITHRDLKPENVMITPQRTAKILDFGLAKVTDAPLGSDAETDLRLTGAHQVVGTAAYMSPEQASAQPVDYRSDQFSFGLIVYEMATGSNPFRRPTLLETLSAIHKEDAPPLEELCPELPDSLLWIVERCLAKNPAERYASTEDLARDLTRLRVRSLPARAIVKHPRRSKLAWLAAAATVAILLATTIFLARRAARPVDLRPLHVALHTPELHVFIGLGAFSLDLSPDGQRLVAGAGNGLWVRDLGSTSGKPIPGTGGGYSPAWSPDGSQIAFFASGKLKIVGLDGGPPRVVCEVEPEGNLSWTSANTILFAQVAPRGFGVFSVNPAGGTPVRLSSVSQARGESFHLWPRMLPDEKHFLYLVLHEKLEQPHSLRVAPISGGPAKEIGRIDSRAVPHGSKLIFVRDGSLVGQNFDAGRMELTGEAVTLVNRLHYFRSNGMAPFATSKNGTILYQSGRDDASLLWMTRTGTPEGELARGVFGRRGRISPDGRQFATGLVDRKLGTSDLWIYDLDRNSKSRLTHDVTDEMLPVWSRDGRALFLTSDVAGPPDIHRLDLNSEQQELTFRGPEIDEPLDVSPDGRHLLFMEMHRQTGKSIWIVPLADPKSPRSLIRTPFSEDSARFSPDGRWIAFASNRTGAMEVYVVPFPEPGPPVLVSQGGGRSPSWRSDGRELFYLGRDNTILSVSVESGGKLNLGKPRVLFRSSRGIIDFEVLPDGSRFLVTTSVEEKTPDLQLVLNALPPL